MPDPRYQGWKRDTSKLTPFKAVWKHGTTKTIRVPIALADSVLAYARALDRGELLQVSDAIATILTKIDAKEYGYRANHASQLIKDLRELVNSE